MIQKYSKDLDYSYTEGFFPTFEMIQFKRDAFRMVYVSSDAVDSDVRSLDSHTYNFLKNEAKTAVSQAAVLPCVNIHTVVC